MVNGLLNLSMGIGILFGIAFGSIGKGAEIIFLAIIGGNFFYIALVLMLPGVMHTKKCPGYTAMLSFFGGVMIMLGIVFLE